ncbi:Uncharacterised protein [Bordetella pertussis]|nr:Uncharacterised protein [Bordetella pertussis]CFW35881.1 Uncharacterised protein [Bordetella pertussis]
MPWKPSVKVSFSAIGSIDVASPWYDQRKVLAFAVADRPAAAMASASAVCLMNGEIRIALVLRVRRAVCAGSDRAPVVG